MNDIARQIDNMVGNQLARGVNPTLSRVNVGGDTAGVQRVTVGGNTDHATLEQVTAPTAPSSGRQHDSGINTKAAAAQLKGELARYEARLAEHTFDPRTGQKAYTLQGPERESVERAYQQAKKTAALQLEQWKRLDAQRAADAQSQEGQRLREAFVTGDPRKAAMLDEALERQRAEAVAARIIAHEIAQATK